jgi:hypothetical protein
LECGELVNHRPQGNGSYSTGTFALAGSVASSPWGTSQELQRQWHPFHFCMGDLRGLIEQTADCRDFALLPRAEVSSPAALDTGQIDHT